MTVEILTRDEEAALVLAQLAVGTLISIRDGILPIDAAIWGISVPCETAPPAVQELLPEGLRDLLYACDELQIPLEIAGREVFLREAERYIDGLNRFIAESAPRYWRMFLRRSTVLEDRRAERRRARERQLAERRERERQEGEGQAREAEGREPA